MYVKDPISRHTKLGDRWIGPVTWIGKTDRDDQHTTVSTYGRAVELYRATPRIPLSQRWKAEAMTRIKVTPGNRRSLSRVRSSRHDGTSLGQCCNSSDPRQIVGTAREMVELTQKAVVSVSRRSGTGKRRGNCAPWQVSWGVPLEELVRLRPMPALQNAHIQ